ncbi:hypothetical protein [Streptomyces sp. NPDC088775]|uniref:hypothetical protein n=1 Tax=Streptomyces sp. NPDC088775 TaxID=3365896 RepID=UPI0037F94FF1
MSPTPPPSGTPSGPAPGRVLGAMPGRAAGPAPTARPVSASAPASFPTASPTSVPVVTAASIPVFTASARPPSASAALPPSAASPAPTGRPRHGLALGLAAATVVLGGTSVTPASAASSAAPVSSSGSTTADQQPACGDPAAKDFPISTRIHGGPDTYASGGGYGTWFLDLTNTTTESCRAIHPVLVLTDEDRKLTSDQIQLNFSEQARPGTEHRVTWETTDQDEQIGVFGGTAGDTFGGFTVPAGRTVTIQVRMAFTSDTSPGRITANAAVVQRQRTAGGKDDGAWVGESEEYPFTVVEDSDGGETGETTGTGEPTEMGEATGTDEATESGDIAEAGETAGTSEVGGTGGTGNTGDTPRDPLLDGTRPSTSATDDTDDTDDTDNTDDPRWPAEPGRTPEQDDRPELAATGTGSVPSTGLAVTTLLIGGGAMVVKARRLRRAQP